MRFIFRRGHVWAGAFLIVCLVLALTSSCANNPSSVVSDGKGTPADAEKFIADAEKRLLDLNIKYSRADWVKATFITGHTEALSAAANEAVIAATTELADRSKRFDGLQLAPDVTRKLKLLKLALTLPAPKDPTEREELTKLAASLDADYGKGKYCPDGDKGKCLSLGDMEKILRRIEPGRVERLAWLATGFATLRKNSALVELSIRGAVRDGFKDNGAMWRAKSTGTRRLCREREDSGNRSRLTIARHVHPQASEK